MKYKKKCMHCCMYAFVYVFLGLGCNDPITHSYKSGNSITVLHVCTTFQVVEDPVKFETGWNSCFRISAVIWDRSSMYS